MNSGKKNTRVSRDQWLRVALDRFAKTGEEGLRVEKLARLLLFGVPVQLRSTQTRCLVLVACLALAPLPHLAADEEASDARPLADDATLVPLNNLFDRRYAVYWRVS